MIPTRKLPAVSERSLARCIKAVEGGVVRFPDVAIVDPFAVGRALSEVAPTAKIEESQAREQVTGE